MPSVRAADGTSSAPRPCRRHGSPGGSQRDELGELGRGERVDRERLDPGERAHGVHEPPARPHGRRGAREQRALQVGELGRVARLHAPARVGPPAQHAEPGARRVEQDAIEGVASRTGSRRRRRRSGTTEVSRHRATLRITVRTRAGWTSAATTRPSSCMRSAAPPALPPGADATSSTRSPGCGSSAATTAWLAWSCGRDPTLAERVERTEIAGVANEERAGHERTRLDLDPERRAARRRRRRSSCASGSRAA